MEWTLEHPGPWMYENSQRNLLENICIPRYYCVCGPAVTLGDQNVTVYQNSAEYCSRQSYINIFSYLVCIPWNNYSRVVPVLSQAPCHEDLWGNGGIAPCILNFGTRKRWVVSSTSRPLCSQYPLDGRLSGPQNRTGRGGGNRTQSSSP